MERLNIPGRIFTGRLFSLALLCFHEAFFAWAAVKMFDNYWVTLNLLGLVETVL